MSLTTSDLHTSLAYRLGETAAPSDSTTKAIRLEWFNQGYFLLSRRRNWWWLEATSTANTNTGSTTGYPEPSDLRAFKELKIGTIYYDEIPYESNRIYQGVSAIVSLPTVTKGYKYYRFGGRYYLLTTDSADATAHNIHYIKRLTSKVADGGTFLIPDEYLEALVAYAEGRYWMSITQQAKAQVPFQEFEEIYQEMVKEQGRRTSGSSGFSVKEPEDADAMNPA
jgi:hypothetical protein